MRVRDRVNAQHQEVGPLLLLLLLGVLLLVRGAWWGLLLLVLLSHAFAYIDLVFAPYGFNKLAQVPLYGRAPHNVRGAGSRCSMQSCMGVTVHAHTACLCVCWVVRQACPDV